MPWWGGGGREEAPPPPVAGEVDAPLPELEAQEARLRACGATKWVTAEAEQMIARAARRESERAEAVRLSPPTGAAARDRGSLGAWLGV